MPQARPSHEILRDLDAEIRRLLWTISTDQLEQLLRICGDRNTKITGVPPMVAARYFRESIEQQLRLGGLTLEGFRNAVVKIKDHMQRSLSIDSIIPSVEPCFERAFFVFGLRRGGNHAIAEWLKGHFPEGDVLHLNNAEIAFFEKKEDCIRFGIERHHSQRLENIKPVLLVGYENLDFHDFPIDHNGRIARRSDLVVVLRDYPNMAASIARISGDRPALVFLTRLRDFPQQWKYYAQRFLEGTREFTYVRFPDWFQNVKYRQHLSARLGLAFSDHGLNVVSPHGRGSSFDGTSKDGSAQSMNVLSRWKEMIDDDLFRLLLRVDDDIPTLNERLFGNSKKPWAESGPVIEQ